MYHPYLTGKLKVFVAFRWLQNEKVPAVAAAARVQAVQNKLKRKRRKRKKKSSKVKCFV